ncbi:MAG: cytochrome c-type biogenesis protein CcmH [Hyphomicrobiales bacterium]|nr:cytochrome c-type biogenesis protein CcmH [Hyphomicrobiales bacterium]
MKRSLASALLLLALAAPAHAVQPDEILPDPVLEARARHLSEQLRCMVCQNQSIDDSDAALAKDLRVLVRERLKAGDSDAQVKDYLVARYGDFILLKPPFKTETLALWLAPLAALVLGAAAVLSRRRRPEPVAPLTAEEKATLESLTRES